jgi:hypothetical protein
VAQYSLQPNTGISVTSELSVDILDTDRDLCHRAEVTKSVAIIRSSITKLQVRHKSFNRKCITVYCIFNGFYKVISPTEIVQSDLHCYLDINFSAHMFRDYYINYLKYDHRQNVQRLTDLCRTLYYKYF